jgi:hypothetical protein
MSVLDKEHILNNTRKGNNMKNTISALLLSMFAASAFAQGIPVSASAVATDDVSARTAATDPKDNRRPGPSVADSDCCGIPVSAPYIAASVATLNCCGTPVSAPQVAKAEDDSSSFAMAGLGFGLFGLVGVSKLARRKKQKGTETL